MPQHNTKRADLANGWLRGEDLWGDPVTLNMLIVDMLLHPYVLSMTLTEPPAAALGDMFVVAPGGTLQWAGHDNQLAIWGEKGWLFFTPYKGVRIRCANPAKWFWWNGTDWIGEDQNTADEPVQGTKYDISVSVGFEAEPRDTILYLPLPQAMTLAAGAAGSKARCDNMPTAAIVMTLQRNRTQIGTITFVPTGFTGIVTVPTNVTFAEDDTISIVLPAAMPEGFQNYGIVIRMLLVP